MFSRFDEIMIGATSYTIETGYNAHSVGPVTINGGVVITISSGQRWLVS